MTDAITDSAGLSGPVTEAVSPKKRSVGANATKKAAKDAPAVDNMVMQEVVATETSGVIGTPNKAHTDGPVKSNTRSKSNGTISSSVADKVFEKTDVMVEPDKDKVAVWSPKNIRWSNVGTINKGYNIVTKEAADKWTTLEGIRIASPEEVATHYGK